MPWDNERETGFSYRLGWKNNKYVVTSKELFLMAMILDRVSSPVFVLLATFLGSRPGWDIE